ncbi:L,D-transpeptidase family protein [Goodfellowiella coeruleoviolacea]|uniref:L,D-transpeptidase family protein n=1 Tax=Goodfellowiella coeruleoviolacea TaxID=334858 RepID=UPI0020A37FF4|nr:L,D-transpeptidase family protein [Goodfellowiella coeruleoviolacea]
MRSRRLSLSAAVVAAVAALFGTVVDAEAPPRPARWSLPLPYQGEARQVITVVAPEPTATSATLTAWQREPTGWSPALGPVRADVGTDGVGPASEAVARTPAGVWQLTEAFGSLPSNGTRLPYRRIDTADWWVSDTRSPHYNTHVRCAPGTCPFDEDSGENLGRVGPAYQHAVVLDYNRDPVLPGAGSAFFLHVSQGRPTAGCVAVPGADLDALMRWLDPAAQPVIAIGVAGTPGPRSTIG